MAAVLWVHIPEGETAQRDWTGKKYKFFVRENRFGSKIWNKEENMSVNLTVYFWSDSNRTLFSPPHLSLCNSI